MVVVDSRGGDLIAALKLLIDQSAFADR